MRAPRYRRLLVALAIATILIGAAWWLSRPRIDPRFVGKWAMHMEETTWPIPIYEFRPDGTATIWTPADMQNSSYDPNPILWKMDGNTLTWRHDYPLKELIFQWYLRLRYRFWDKKLTPTPDAGWTIVKATPDEIHLDVNAGNSPPRLWILRRTD